MFCCFDLKILRGMEKILSVITVCYNEKELERTCKSIVEQTFQDFEWVVIDGGSNSETLEILNKYKSRMDVFVSEKDTGIYNAMNKGIALASGKWLNFMNAGDTFHESNTLENVFVKNADVLKNADIVYCDSLFCNPDNTSDLNEFPDKPDYFFWQCNSLNHQASFIRRSLFEKFGKYDEGYRICADFDKFLLFQKEKCKFRHLKIIVSNFFTDGFSNINKGATAIEKEGIINKYFSYKYKTLYTLKLFSVLPIFRIKKRRDGKKYALIFLKIPVFTWEPLKKQF